jgi:magnesium chelatase family protein
MISNIYTGATNGIEGFKISVETDTISGLPNVIIVGLPDAAVSEAKERIRSAIKNSGYMFPMKRVIINLAPADVRKEGTGFDLPMAVGVLLAGGEVMSNNLDDTAFIGELSLDGDLRPVNGVLPTVLGLMEAGIKKVVVPYANAGEAALAGDIEVYGVKNLAEVVNFLNPSAISDFNIKPYKVDISNYLAQHPENTAVYDFKDVKGQEKAKRAMEIAAAGGHNMLMAGSPGSGKTLLAKCFSSILPPLEYSEAIELTKIYSISGLLEKDRPLMNVRPFRSPHHTASPAGIIGGGTNPKPGEITLAHRGVLFLDEVVEFPRTVLEVLRQPLEDGVVTISRAQTSIKYPADFILLAAMNPCPCGYYGDAQKKCVCSDMQIKRYWSRLSGPLLDRIDLQIEVARLSDDELLGKAATGESSATIRERVVRARNIQIERFKGENIVSNAQMSPKLIKKHCKLDSASEELLKSAIARFNLSARSYDRILKLSRTIADLKDSENIAAQHIAEAIQYRNIDRLVKV